MAKMKAIAIQRWGDDGIQIDFDLVQPVEGAATSHTEMADPSNAAEFSRLLAIKLYDEIDISHTNAEATP